VFLQFCIERIRALISILREFLFVAETTDFPKGGPDLCFPLIAPWVNVFGVDIFG
jgi:hypothetical protein